MAEKISLSQVRDTLASWLGGSEACLDTRKVALFESMIAACDTHLTQPAQAVDVVAIREVIDILLADGAPFGVKPLAQKLTRAIGNAQAEGAVNERCQKVMRNRGKPYPRTCYVCGLWGPCVTSDAQLATTPPTQATPNAHE